ncbi:MAG: hypothetical protein HKN29_10675, partial [Rhodothermales bacterium]|nr:hypothetical protein [Rhodothermales bacterium]
DLLLAWWVGQSLELGAAGSVLGAGLAGFSRRKIYLRVAGLVVLCLVATIGLQIAGWAPAARML